MKRLIALILALVLLLALSGCGKRSYEDAPDPIATITMEDGTELRFELCLQVAPITVANFVKLANEGFYDGLQFYRVVPGVLIEAGSPTNNGRGNAGWTIKGEFADNGWENTISHTRGVISMALQEGDPDSASSIFFIMQGEYAQDYDGHYAAFGYAYDSETLKAIDTLASKPVDGSYSPLSKLVIDNIRVDTHGYDIEGPTLKLKDK